MEDRDVRCNRNTEIVCDKTGDNLILIDFIDNLLRVGADAFKELVNDLTQTASLAEDNLWVGNRLCEMDLFF